jgi:mono/diheme cytochrome c family protein
MRAILSVLLVLAGPAAASADEQLENAAKDFVTLCTSCHGPSGTGDGPMAKNLRKSVPDLTQISARNGGSFPEDMVFETIAGLGMPDAHGTRDMPVWGDLFVSAEIGNSTKLEDAMKASDHAAKRIVGLVRYLEQIQAKP